MDSVGSCQHYILSPNRFEETVVEHDLTVDEVSHMAVIDLILSDADQERFARQARREGMSLSDWIVAAAEDRIADRQTIDRFEESEDIAN